MIEYKGDEGEEMRGTREWDGGESEAKADCILLHGWMWRRVSVGSVAALDRVYSYPC
jgi:hypothetical protein